MILNKTCLPLESECLQLNPEELEVLLPQHHAVFLLMAPFFVE